MRKRKTDGESGAIAHFAIDGGRPAAPLDHLLLELIEGESLAQKLTEGALPIEDVLRFGVQIPVWSPDGRRFLILAPLGRDALQPATVVLNWTSALP